MPSERTSVATPDRANANKKRNKILNEGSVPHVICHFFRIALLRVSSCKLLLAFKTQIISFSNWRGHRFSSDPVILLGCTHFCTAPSLPAHAPTSLLVPVPSGCDVLLHLQVLAWRKSHTAEVLEVPSAGRIPALG